MVKTCTNCGFGNPEGNSKCAVCGTELKSFGEGRQGFTKEDVRNEAITGLTKVRMGSIIVLVGSIAGTVLLFFYYYTVFASLLNGFTLPPTNATNPYNFGIFTNLFQFLIIIMAVDFIISGVSIFMIYSGFGQLKSLNQRLSIGRTGGFLFLIGFIMLAAGLLYLMYSILLLSGNTSPTTIPTTTATSSVLSILLLFVGSIVALVGAIMLAIGLFRVGDVFNDSLIKVGGILYILLAFIGAILLIIGITGLLNKIRNAPAMQDHELQSQV